MKNLVHWGIICLALATAGRLVAQGPGSCPVAADGTCTVRDGVPCKTTPGLPKPDGTCKSSKLGHGDIVGQCLCVATPAATPSPTPTKTDDGGFTALLVFVVLLAAWTAVKVRPHLSSGRA